MIRLFQIARTLSIETQEVVKLLGDLGIEAKSASSTVEEIVATQFCKRIARERNIALPDGPLFRQRSAPKGKKKAKGKLEPTPAPRPALGKPRLVKVPKPAEAETAAPDVAAEAPTVLAATPATEEAPPPEAPKQPPPPKKHFAAGGRLRLQIETERVEKPAAARTDTTAPATTAAEPVREAEPNRGCRTADAGFRRACRRTDRPHNRQQGSYRQAAGGRAVRRRTACRRYRQKAGGRAARRRTACRRYRQKAGGRAARRRTACRRYRQKAGGCAARRRTTCAASRNTSRTGGDGCCRCDDRDSRRARRSRACAAHPGGPADRAGRSAQAPPPGGGAEAGRETPGAAKRHTRPAESTRSRHRRCGRRRFDPCRPGRRSAVIVRRRDLITVRADAAPSTGGRARPPRLPRRRRRRPLHAPSPSPRV